MLLDVSVTPKDKRSNNKHFAFKIFFCETTGPIDFCISTNDVCESPLHTFNVVLVKKHWVEGQFLSRKLTNLIEREQCLNNQIILVNIAVHFFF
jgi:hypothetical protein